MAVVYTVLGSLWNPLINNSKGGIPSSVCKFVFNSLWEDTLFDCNMRAGLLGFLSRPVPHSWQFPKKITESTLGYKLIGPLGQATY